MSEFYFSAATFHFFWGGVPGGPPRSRKAPPDLASPPPPLPSAESSSSDLASRQTCLGALFSCLKRKNGNGYFPPHLFSLYFWAPTFSKLTLGPSLEAAKGIEKEEKGERKERQRRCVRRPPPPPPRVFPRPLHLLLLLSRWFRFPFPFFFSLWPPIPGIRIKIGLSVVFLPLFVARAHFTGRYQHFFDDLFQLWAVKEIIPQYRRLLTSVDLD